MTPVRRRSLFASLPVAALMSATAWAGPLKVRFGTASEGGGFVIYGVAFADAIRLIEPDFFAKGFEYSNDMPKTTLDETKAVESYGGEMIFTPGDVVYSTTKFLKAAPPNLRAEKLLSLMGQIGISFDDLRETINDFNKFHVHVVGDTIVDTYTRTTLYGGVTKTPTFSVLLGGQENYVGGAAIVALHLRAAGAGVRFTTILGDDARGKFVTEELEKHHIRVDEIIDHNRPTTNKNVIVTADGYRMLKIDTLDNSPINTKMERVIHESIIIGKSNAVVFSDFRHGIFNKNSIPKFTRAIPKGSFKVADSQVASRWGNITEFQYFDLITPNEREARFSLADQDSNIGQLAGTVKEKCRAKNIILKLGERGLFLLNSDMRQSVESFTDNLRDAVGAGDALLAYATLAMLSSKSLPVAAIIGSIAAACECEYDGNIPVTPEDVFKKIDQIERM